MKEPAMIFSGDDSRNMWDMINDATTAEQTRDALFLVCCKMQELEAKLSGDKCPCCGARKEQAVDKTRGDTAAD